MLFYQAKGVNSVKTGLLTSRNQRTSATPGFARASQVRRRRSPSSRGARGEAGRMVRRGGSGEEGEVWGGGEDGEAGRM